MRPGDYLAGLLGIVVLGVVMFCLGALTTYVSRLIPLSIVSVLTLKVVWTLVFVAVFMLASLTGCLMFKLAKMLGDRSRY